LAKTILGKLENRKYIEFSAKSRNALQDELYQRLTKTVLTEEDLTNQVRAHVAKVSDAISEQNFTETEAFQSQKRALKSRLEDNAIQGFYLKDTLRSVCADVCKFLFDSKYVDDVFESDEAIQKLAMETIQTFDETKIS
jgi:hypothetical protein